MTQKGLLVSSVELYDSPSEDLLNRSKDFKTKQGIVSDARDIS